MGRLLEMEESLAYTTDRSGINVERCGGPRVLHAFRNYDPPPFDSFGRSVTVTVVVQENNSLAAFVAEHATVVVPIRN